MYQIVANAVQSQKGGWSRSIQIPTFFLDEGIQGITNEEDAVRVAKKIINPTDDESLTVYVSVLKMEAV